MPNFTAVVRTSYRDVSGLVLSLRGEDLVEDPFNPGHVKVWPNRAPGVPSKPMWRAPSDAVAYQGGRYTTPEQLDVTIQPELQILGPSRKVKFTGTEFLKGSIPVALPETVRGLSFAFNFTPDGPDTPTQVIYDDGTQRISRVRAGGDGEFKIGSNAVPFGAGLNDAVYLVSGSPADLYYSELNTFNNTVVGASVGQLGPGDFYLGRAVGGDYLVGSIGSFHAWTRELSPLERDFVFLTLSDDNTTMFTANSYAYLTNEVWTDATGTSGTNEIVRVRPQNAVFPHFKLARKTGLSPARVQIAASEDGLVKPDSELTETFHLHWVEYPGVTAPAIIQDAGWSSVFDCAVRFAGHYCARVWRNDGGSVLLHFDVEVT